MRSWRVGMPVVVLLAAGGWLTLGGVFPSGADRSSAQESSRDSEVVLGDELARDMGLTPITHFPVTDCHYFAEARDLVTGSISAYCLDGAVQDDLSFTKLAIMFKGRVPTAIDERIFDLQEQLSLLPDNSSYDPQRASIAAEIMSLQAELG